MKQAPPNPDLFTHRDIAVAINNALIMATKPPSGEIPEAVMRKLRSYSEALVEPTLAHMDEGLIAPEHLVFVHLANALRVQQINVSGAAKLPGAKASKALFKESK